MRRHHWIEFAGTRISLDGESAIVGRNVDCDVVLQDDRVSRHHVLFRVVGDGIEVVPLGAREIHVSGAVHDSTQTLRDGDRVEIEGHAFVARTTGPRAEPDLYWYLERDAGVLVRVGDTRVTVGGGTDDRIVILAWPPGAIALATLGARLVLEACVEGVSVGRPVAVGEMLDVAVGERIALGGVAVRAIALPADPSKPTLTPTPDGPVLSAVLTYLPRGGRLALRIGRRERKVYLSGQRCELVASLLQPPAPYCAGDTIPDAVLAERLWPNTFAGRTDINTLLWRVRKDFADAGLDRVTFFDRQGGGLRVKLAEGGVAEVHGRPVEPT